MDFVSPVYGEAYSALHLFNCIGCVLDELDEFPDTFRDQLSVKTADLWSLDYWEKQYGIVPDLDATEEDRRRNLLEKWVGDLIIQKGLRTFSLQCWDIKLR